MIYRGDRLPEGAAGQRVRRRFADQPGPPPRRSRTMARDELGAERVPKGEFLASTDERFRPGQSVLRARRHDLRRRHVSRRRAGRAVSDRVPQGLHRQARARAARWQRPDLARRARLDDAATGRPALSKETPAGLVALLSHPNGWWRDTAQQLLVQRGDDRWSPALKQLALNAPDCRAPGCTRCGRSTAWMRSTKTPSLQALKHVSPDVRAASIRLSERWIGQPDDRLQAAVLQQMNNPNWTVRRQLAASLGALPGGAAARRR